MAGRDIMVKETEGVILIHLGSSKTLTALKENLLHKMAALGEQVGSMLVVDVGARRLTKKEMHELRSLVSENGFYLKSLIARGKVVEFEDMTERPQEISIQDVPIGREGAQGTKDTMLVKQTVRSGQVLYHEGNIVIIGDVNPGAEIVAGGNIVVMGYMRGLAHAGCKGDEQAVVTAFRLNPTQIRIANHITRPPDGENEAGTQPEIAYIKDGRVVIEKFKV